MKAALIGRKYGKWLVISYSHKNKEYQNFWFCACECGYEGVLEQSRLQNGYTTQCKQCSDLQRRKYKCVAVGDKYGKWLVLRIDDKDYQRVHVQCECGKIKSVDKNSLSQGESTQCASCRGRAVATKHGQNRKNQTTAEYRAWCNMKNRVLNPRLPEYKNYGGRGIEIWPAWILSFEAFFKDIGSRPSELHSLERIDNNGNYEPGNVKWALLHEQIINRRISVRINGKYLGIRRLAQKLHMKEKTIKNLFCIAKFSLDEVHKFSKFSHYQKIQMGISINQGKPLTFEEIRQIVSPVLPSPKRHPLYCAWHSMKQRCNNPKNKDYSNYGGRGIKVASPLQDFKDFLIFINNVLGPKPSSKHQLDRINPNANYEPLNLRWATPKQQMRNKQETFRIQGIGVSANELSKKYRLNRGSVVQLLRQGWDEKGIALYSQMSFREKKKRRVLIQKLPQSAIFKSR